MLHAWFEQPDEIYDGLLALRRDLISESVKNLSWDYSEDDDYLTTMFRTLVIDFAGKAGYPE
jgi:aminopeptidase 2